MDEEEASDAFVAWAWFVLLIFIVLMVAVVVYVVRSTASAREACEDAGGVYVVTRGDNVCLERDSVVIP